MYENEIDFRTPDEERRVRNLTRKASLLVGLIGVVVLFFKAWVPGLLCLILGELFDINAKTQWPKIED